MSNQFNYFNYNATIVMVNIMDILYRNSILYVNINSLTSSKEIVTKIDSILSEFNISNIVIESTNKDRLLNNSIKLLNKKYNNRIKVK